MTAEMIEEAERLVAAGSYPEAHALCLRIIAASPAEARPYLLIGQLAAHAGQLGQAAELFEHAAARDRRRAEYPAQLARCLLMMNRLGAAKAAADQAMALNPNDPESLAAVGLVYSRIGPAQAALHLLGRAAELQPHKAERHHNLGLALQFTGHFDGAEAAFREALRCDREFHLSWLALAELGRQTREHNLLAELIALFSRREDPDWRLHLGHAVARTLEDLGRHPEALEWLARAKAPKRRTVRYDPGEDAALFNAAITTSGPPVPAAEQSDAPIFVVGLPRTGTTLVDRILSAHSQAMSVGEPFEFMFATKQMVRTPSPRALDAVTLRAAVGADLARLGSLYLEGVAPLRGGTARFIDKMPLNVFYAGLIHRSLPNARIVCLRRNPVDAAVSNYRQLFGPAFAYYFYALDLEDVGRYCAGFERLASHWRRTLPPDRFMEVRYEDLVADQERVTRDLLAFCGLPWDARCLAPHSATDAVMTASAVQVRQPIHAGFIDRWRRYGDGLAPLVRVLEEHGLGPGPSPIGRPPS